MMFVGNFASLLLAQAPATVADPRANALSALALPVAIMVVMYVVMVRPQQKKQKEIANLLKSLKAGDKVVTSSGIVGVVITVKENRVTLRSGDTKLELLKSAVIEITEKDSSPTPA
jgi:preprotein translocase subunit YajC